MIAIGSGKRRVLSCAVLIIFVLLSVWALIPNRGSDQDGGFSSSELIKEETGDGTVITYYDASGKPTVAVDKGYAILKKTKNAMGKTEKELYFDGDGEAKKRAGGYYATAYSYSGNETLVTYLDEDGKLTETTSGYAAIKRIADGEGRTVNEFYLDKDLEPAECSGGYYGIYNEYGADKKVSSVTYLGASGDPVLTRSGYAKKTYLRGDDGNVKREYYLGLSGEKIMASAGQFGEEYIRDENNRVLRVTYLDSNYSPAPGTAGYSVTERTYHKNGTVDSEMYFDLEGNPVRLSKGQYGIKSVSGVRYLLNKDGKIMLSVDNVLNGFPYTVALIGAAISVAVLLLPKKPAAVLTGAYVVFILYETIMFRETAWLKTNMELFSYVGTFFENASSRIGVVDNVWLFVPFGAGVCRFFGVKKAILFSFLFTVAIESAQYITSLGTAELNDIFGNTLGGVIGSLSAITIKIKRKSA